MEVMGPERILPNSEEELGHDRPTDGGAVPDEWSGEDMEEDEAGAADEDDEDNGGYYYQPLNQDPEGMSVPTEQPDEAGSHAEQIQEVQERIEVSRLSQAMVSEDTGAGLDCFLLSVPYVEKG